MLPVSTYHPSVIMCCREVVEPICLLKSIDIEKLGIYLDDDRSAALPLDYDIYSLTGHVLHVMGKHTQALPCLATLPLHLQTSFILIMVVPMLLGFIVSLIWFEAVALNCCLVNVLGLWGSLS